MISTLPALGIRFDIGKVESAAYGVACWEVIWNAVRIDTLAGALLFEGDTSSTLVGSENVFCIAVQTPDERVLESIRRALEESADFGAVAATPAFNQGRSLFGEPLVEAGRIDSEGRLEGKAYNSGPALANFEKKGTTKK